MKSEQSKKHSPSRAKRRYPKWFYLVIIFFPVVFLLVLELALRGVDYGKNYDTFIKVSDNLDEYLFFNPEMVSKFFSDKSVVPSVVPDAFKEIKNPETFRIFVLGGSSAAGYPYPTNASFSRQLKRRLQLVYQAKDFEVVNLGVSAVNSVFMAHVIDDVLKQSPDLILIYTGHNEYYGAYGAAGSGLIIPPGVLLMIKEFKIYQLVESILGVFSSDKESGGRTLMAEMAGDNLVPLDSDAYKKGLSNFNDNLDYILARCSSSHIPVIIGNVTSNLMRFPLDYIVNNASEALKTYDKGIAELDSNYPSAKQLLVNAKDQDMLRFRAPEATNEIIKSEADKYNFAMVNVDSVFRNYYHNRLPGYKLFADHLHPNIDGYFLLSKVFFDGIKRSNVISGNLNKSVSGIADRILRNTFPFTRLDSTYADIKLKVLMGSYPFTKVNNTNSVLAAYPLKNKADSLAMSAINGQISWDNAHYKLAEYYFGKKAYNKFFNEMMALIYDKPYDTYRYNAATEYLNECGRYDLAYTVVSLWNRIRPSLSNLKELGRLSYELGKYSRAVYFFNIVFKSDKNDPNAMLIAAKSHLKLGNMEAAKKLLIFSQRLNPESREINRLLDSLSNN